MLTVSIGERKKMSNYQSPNRKILELLMVLMPSILFVLIFIQRYNSQVPAVMWHQAFSRVIPLEMEDEEQVMLEPFACFSDRGCPDDHFSFYIQSGTTSRIPPKICVENNLVLGEELHNTDMGINAVILDGKTGDVMRTKHVEVMGGDLIHLKELLANIKNGSVVLMTFYNHPSTQLTEAARLMIARQASKSTQSLGFRDNWVFVTNGSAVLNFEKFMLKENEWDSFPEVVELQGCVSKVQNKWEL